jgi:hypothetical protein
MLFDQIKEMVHFLQMSDDPIIVFSKLTILFILLFLAVRFFLIGNLFKRCARIDKDSYKSIRKEYLAGAWIGWLFCVLGIGLFHLVRIFPHFFLRYLSFDSWLFCVGLLMLVGIFYHLYFLSRGVLVVFSKRIEIEKN